jgi:hypothetical protein
MKTAREEPQIAGSASPAIEHMAREIRTDPAQKQVGCEARKIAAAGEVFSLDFSL